jgi:large subunit ribosomal protein L4
MASLDVKDAAGKKTGSVTLDDAVFGIEPNGPVLHQVVTAQLAARRAGTQSTKTRAEVRGGGAKPWKQKGTGRARQGSIRSPQWRGGGVALGPKPRSYAQKTPKKMVKLALRSALSDRAAEGKVAVVDWGFDAPKTKDGIAALEKLGLEGKVLVVLGDEDRNVALSFRNLAGRVQLIKASELNAYDVLVNDWIVFTEGTLPTAEAPKADTATEAPAEEAPATQAPAKKTPAKKAAAKDEAPADEPEPAADTDEAADDSGAEEEGD